MSAFKQFLSTDVTVVPFVVNKSFSFVGSASLAAANIKNYIGFNTSYSSTIPGPIGFSTTFPRQISSYQSQSVALIYNSVKQLYYTNYIPAPSQSQSPSPVYDYNGNLIEDYTTTSINARFYNYEQTSLFQTNSLNYTSDYGFERYFPMQSDNILSTSSQITVLSIPKDLYGDYINPNSLYIRYRMQGEWIIITDDGNGILRFNNVEPDNQPVSGIISYQHGLISFSKEYDDNEPISFWVNGNSDLSMTCSFQSSRTIYETQYKCTIRPDEFNFSLNPSLISGSTDDTPYNFVTSSYFSPYVTTVGLYNERQELLAVAKLAQPLPTSNTTDTTIVINIDR